MKIKDWLLFWLLGIIWGTSFLWIKIAVTEISPLMLVSFRTLFATLGLAVFLLLVRSARGTWDADPQTMVGFHRDGADQYCHPLAANLVGWAIYRLRAVFDPQFHHAAVYDHDLAVLCQLMTASRLIKAAGLLTGFAGVVILLYPNLGAVWSNHLAGQAAVLIAALCYGGSTVFARKMAKGLPAQMQAFLQFFMATIMIWVFTLAAERPLVFPRLPITWLALLWLGLLGSGLAYILYFDLLPRIGPTRMSMVTYILPLVASTVGDHLPGRALSLGRHHRRAADPFWNFDRQPAARSHKH
jgi:drug/metabolite transporter (DMT)-like permease